MFDDIFTLKDSTTLIEKFKPDIVIDDFIQLIRVDSRLEGRRFEIEQIMTEYKMLSKKLFRSLKNFYFHTAITKTVTFLRKSVNFYRYMFMYSICARNIVERETKLRNFTTKILRILHLLPCLHSSADLFR